MNLTNVEIGLILVEGSILVSLLIMVLLVKKALRPIPAKTSGFSTPDPKGLPLDWNHLDGLLKESEAISQELSRNLEEKKEIAKRLLETLDERIQNLNQLLGKIEGKSVTPVVEGKNPEGTNPILEMALTG